MLAADQAKRHAKANVASVVTFMCRAPAREKNLRAQVLHKFCTWRPQVFHMIVAMPVSGAFPGVQ